MKVGSSSSIQASRPLNLLNWAASSPSAGRLPSFPCLAGYLKPAFEPTKPSRAAIVLLALRLESLSYRLNLPIGGGLIPLPFTVPCDLYTDTPIYASLVKGESAERRESPLPVKRLKKQEQKQSLERGEHLPTLWLVYTIQQSEPIPFRFILVCWGDEEMNFGIQLQRNSARSFRVGKVPALLGQAGKALFLMKSTLQSLPLFPPGVPKGMPGRIEGIRTRCPRSGVGGRDRIHLIAWEKALRSFDLEAWAGALANLKKQIRYFQQENKKGRNKSGEKGKCLHKGRERKGDSTNKSEKGSKEGTHLDRATTGDRIWKEINMFSRTNRFTPSMTAHQGNNGQSRQRQARMLLPTRPIQGNLTLRAENPSHFRQRGNDDG
ncbi:hypothetical protein Tco_0462942 [Tanacetum coccineum]